MGFGRTSKMIIPVLMTPSAVLSPKVLIAGVELKPIKQNEKLIAKNANVVRLKLRASFSSLV